VPVLLTIEPLLGAGVSGWTVTGSVALALHEGAHAVDVHRFNDVDFVVDSFDRIPPALADRFLVNHVHPRAPEGKLLIQLVDPVRALRIDVFRAFGRTLSRARTLAGDSGALKLIAIEDLAARTTALVCGRLRSGKSIEAKYVAAFRRLMFRGEPALLAEAWTDHRQAISSTIDEAIEETRRLLDLRADLVSQDYGADALRMCDRCEAVGAFRVAPPAQIKTILGYC
jgi:hypothetical protein